MKTSVLRLWINFTATIATSVLIGAQAQALPYRSQQFAVASPSPYSASVANEIAALGGNVFDQTVAVALALSVTHPYYAALGGGGFALIRKQPASSVISDKAPPVVEVLDFRETAPKETSRETFIGKDAKLATDGGLASGIPGVPAGLAAMHKKYGKLAWKKLFAPAIRLAEKGFPVSGEWADRTKDEFESFNPAGKKIFGRVVLDKSRPPRERHEPMKPGDIMKQPQLARALKLIRDQGVKAFYEGPIAKDMIDTMKAGGGVMTMADLKDYKVEWREPIQRKWRGHDLYLMPPPSSGGLIIAQALEILDRVEAKRGVPAPMSGEEAHYWGESLKLSFAARGQMGDPMGSTKMTELQGKLLDSARLDRLAGLVSKGDAIVVKDSRSPDLKEALKAPSDNEKPETTHFSLADQEGNAVAFTVTLNGSYGSGVVSDKFGIAMNDEMDDFATQPGVANQYGLIQGEANAVAPGKRPLSSMSPSIIEKDGQFVAVTGAPGGPRIASAVFQSIVRLIAQGADAEEAVTRPRVHHQFLPDTLFVDAKRMAPEVIAKLKGFGHAINESWVAKLYVVRKTPDGLLEAAGDPRGEAAAGGR